MPDDLQHGITPESVAIATTDDHGPQIPLIDYHFDAVLAKQRARNLLDYDLHLTGAPLTRSSLPRRTPPCLAATSHQRVRRRDRQAITNELLRSAVTDLEDELILHIKKRRRLRNGAVKSASEVLAEQRGHAYDQSPSILKGNMVVPLMDLVVSRRKSKLKSKVNSLIYSVSGTLIYHVSSSVRRVRSGVSTQGQSNHNTRL